MRWRAVGKVRVGEPLLAHGVEASADQKRDGDDRGQRGHEPAMDVDARGKRAEKRQQFREEQNEQRPNAVGRAPQLLRQERAVDGGEQKQRQKDAQRTGRRHNVKRFASANAAANTSRSGQSASRLSPRSSASS